MAIKYTCNLDWFECILEGDPMLFADSPPVITRAGSRVALHRKKYGTQHYQEQYSVGVGNREFGNVLVKPREGNKLQSTFVQFRAQNHVLYEIGFMQEFDLMCRTLGWRWRNPTRIDIALDGHGFHQVVDDLWNKRIKKVGQATWGTFFDMNSKLQGYSWGKGGSDKYLRCYNKEEELRKSNKWYVKQMWDRAGLDQTETVQRLELVMRNNELKKYPDFTPDLLDNFEYLASLMRTGFEKWFEFIDPHSNCNTTRAERIEYVDWDAVGGAKLEKASALPSTEVFRFRQASKTAYWTSLATGSPLFDSLAKEYARAIDQIPWLQNNIEKWKAEYWSKMGHNKKGIKHFEYLDGLEVELLFDQIVMLRQPRVKPDKVDLTPLDPAAADHQPQ